MPKQKSNLSRSNFRARHRARSHENAHAEQITDPASIRHPLVPHGTAPLVQDEASLAELIQHLRDAQCFAYDSEFIGELTYVPKLCLVQVASSQRVALMDPLSGLDLTPFWELVADPTLTKIVHAGQQDIEPVIRHLGRPAAGIFDTQIAAGFAGMAYPVSLSRLVLELLDVKLGKGLTFTNWDQRPLSTSQRRYAADDVRYLPAVHALLGERLEQKNHTRWAREECEALCDPALHHFDPDTQLKRVRGAGSLDPRGLSILRELVIWRDAAAREDDLPPRTLLRDEVLVDLSRSPAKQLDKLDKVRGLPRPLKSARGREILDATARGLSATAPSPARNNHADEGPSRRFRVEALWSIMQNICTGQGIDPALVGSRHDTSEFYHLFLHGGDIQSHRMMRGWRREAVGESLLGMLEGRNELSVRWREDQPQSTIQEPMP